MASNTIQYTPQVINQVSEFLDNLHSLPPDELSQNEAETTLVDIAQVMVEKSQRDQWEWIACFCQEGGMSDVFAIADEAGGEDCQRGSLIRGLLAFEVVGIALGHTSVLDLVSSRSSIVKEFVPKYDKVHPKLISASLRTLCHIALHSVQGHFTVIHNQKDQGIVFKRVQDGRH
jgi:hypothetical protein